MGSGNEREQGSWRRVRARPGLLAAVGLVVVGLATAVIVWFEPQSLLFDTVVDEGFPDGQASEGPVALDAPLEEAPADEAPSGGADPAVADPAGDEPAGEDGEGEDGEGEDPVQLEPVALARGSFSSRSRYSVEGQATTYLLGDGSRILRLEDFESTNGPDLYVYLTSADASGSDAELEADVVDLGLLTGNIGSQNYLIPDEVDLERYDTVVIWCRRFTVGFGAADLSAGGA